MKKSFIGIGIYYILPYGYTYSNNTYPNGQASEKFFRTRKQK